MTNEEVIRLLKIEHACSQAKCNRNCSCCDIVQEQETLDVMYKKAIQLIEEKSELEETIDAQDDKIDFYVSKMNEHIRKNENLEEDNLNKQDLINDYVFENAKLTKENERLSKMLEIVLPKALAHENHMFYEHKRTLEQYRADLEKRVENDK